jgi:hypothetical protein
MTKRDEREQGVEPPRTPRTRVVSEAVVAALSDRPPRPRTRVMAEAVVAAIPAEGEAEPGGGADDEAGAGA